MNTFWIQQILVVTTIDYNMKKQILKKEYVFEYGASGTVYSDFIKNLTKAYDKIKRQYPKIKNDNIFVTIKSDTYDDLSISLEFFVLETDEEYTERLIKEEEKHLANKNKIIEEFKKYLKEYPDIMQELLKEHDTKRYN